MSARIGVDAARATLAAIFTLAGFAKLRDGRGLSDSLAEFGLPAPIARAFGAVLPLAELVCGICLMTNRWAVAGACAAVVLLVLFTGGIALNLWRGGAPKCRCFGQMSASPVSWLTVLRNVALLLIAVAIASHADPIPEDGFLFSGISPQALWGSSIGALALLLAASVWFLFRLLEQNGRLFLRLDAIEAKLVDREPELGLRTGHPAPRFALRSVDGSETSLASFEATRPILLLFTEPNCGACEVLQPELALWQRQHSTRITIVPISRGDPEANRRTISEYGIRNVLLQVDREVAQAYSITATPSGVLVMNGRIASHVTPGAVAIRALVSRIVRQANLDATTPLGSPGEGGEEFLST